MLEQAAPVRLEPKQSVLLSGDSKKCEEMLDHSLLSVVEKRVALDFEDRRQAFAHEVAQIHEEMSAIGVLISGGTQQRMLDAIGNEFRIRSALIWHGFARALAAKATPLDDTTATDIKREIERLLDQHSSDLPQQHRKAQEWIRGSTQLRPIAELREAALSRIFSEIDFAVLSQSRRPEAPAGVVIIHQAYGIVQTGGGSTASLTINIGPEERREIEMALGAVQQALENAATLDNGVRTQALELASDVRGELQRNNPNGFRIRGALQGIATTIQTLAAASGAYQLLKGAAALVGLQLP